MSVAVAPGRPLRGEARVPGDKSITHRALLLGSIAQGDTVVRGFLDSGDCRASVEVVQALGAQVVDEGESTIRVRGSGMDGLREPDNVLDCRGSGTTMRLLAGLLAGQPFTSVLTGNPALRSTPWGESSSPSGGWAPRSWAETETDCRRSPSEEAACAASTMTCRWPAPR